MIEAGIGSVTVSIDGLRPPTTACAGCPQLGARLRGAAAGPRRGRQDRLQHADQRADARRAAAAARAARRRGHPLVAAADHGAARQRRRPPGDHPPAVHVPRAVRDARAGDRPLRGARRPPVAGQQPRLLRPARARLRARPSASTGAAARPASPRWASRATAASRTARASAARSTSAATGASTASRAVEESYQLGYIRKRTRRRPVGLLPRLLLRRPPAWPAARPRASRCSGAPATTRSATTARSCWTARGCASASSRSAARPAVGFDNGLFRVIREHKDPELRARTGRWQ
jgi:hypothetical protein